MLRRTKIIAHTVAAPGHVFPFVAVLAELQRRGAAVTLCVNASSGGVPDEIGGVPVRSVRSVEFERFPTCGTRREMQRVWLANHARSGEPAAAATAHLLAEEHPDLVLVDPMLWGSMVVADAANLPWAAVAHNPLTIRGCGLDARGPGLRPARGTVGRIRDRIVDFGIRSSMFRPLLMLNAVRARYGLSPLADFRQVYLTPPLIIAATAEPFEYARTDWPASLVFVGPLLWEPESPSPSWLDQLAQRPLVVLAGSTVPEHKMSQKWIRIAFEAFAGELVEVVATLPVDDVPDRVPANIHVVSFMSHGLALKRALCVVCHGGHGVTTKALSAGVPVVAIPSGLDRYEVARRVEMANAGVMLLERQLTPERLRAAVRSAIERRQGAERIADAFRRTGGAAAAANAIQSLLGTNSRQGASGVS